MNWCRAFVFLSFISFSNLSAAAEIPASWYGVWLGDVEAQNVNQSPFKKKMSFYIQPLGPISGDLTWRVHYQDEKPHNYILRLLNQDKGHYVLDEGDGTLINHYFVNGTLYAEFMSNDKLYTHQIELKDGELIDNGVVFYNRAVKNGGDPSLVSFQFSGCQRALLKKEI